MDDREDAAEVSCEGNAAGGFQPESVAEQSSFATAKSRRATKSNRPPQSGCRRVATRNDVGQECWDRPTTRGSRRPKRSSPGDRSVCRGHRRRSARRRTNRDHRTGRGADFRPSNRQSGLLSTNQLTFPEDLMRSPWQGARTPKHVRSSVAPVVDAHGQYGSGRHDPPLPGWRVRGSVRRRGVGRWRNWHSDSNKLSARLDHDGKLAQRWGGAWGTILGEGTLVMGRRVNHYGTAAVKRRRREYPPRSSHRRARRKCVAPSRP